jgi:hypothetical protein
MYVPKSFRTWWDLIGLERGAPNNDLAILQALGSVILAENLPYMYIKNNAAGAALTDNQVLSCALWLPKAAVLNGVKWLQTTQGNYTADQYNGIGLYTYSGGTLTLVASSTDDGSIWKAAANTLGSKAFSAQYNAAPGLYFIGLLYNSSAQVTAPALASSQGPPVSSILLDFTNSAKILAFLAGQNTLPSPSAMSGWTAYASGIPWLALY